MAITPINVGTAANDGTGDTLRAAMQKININEADLQSQINGKASITGATGIIVLTQAAYDLLDPPNPAVFYAIRDE